jgi:hypothetical protein
MTAWRTSILRWMCLALLVVAAMLFFAARRQETYLEIDATIEQGNRVEVYVNQEAVAPLVAKVLPNRRTVYRFSPLPDPISQLRIDPSEVASAVKIFGISIWSEGKKIRNLPPSDQTLWATPGLLRSDDCSPAGCRFSSTTSDPMLLAKLSSPVALGGAFAGWSNWNTKIAPWLGSGALIAMALLLLPWEHFRWGLRARALGGLALALGVGAVVASTSFELPSGNQTFSEEAFAAEGQNSLPLRVAHVSALAVIALACGLFLMPSRKPSGFEGKTTPFQFGRAARVLLLSCALIGCVAFGSSRDYLGSHSLSILAMMSALAWSAGATVRARRTAGIIGFSMVLIGLAFECGAALYLYPRTISWTPTSLGFVEHHYSFMPGAAQRIAAGLEPLKEVRIWYGWVFPMAFALMQRLSGWGSFGDYFRAIQVLQIAFLVVALLSYGRFYRSSSKGASGGLILAALLIAPYATTLDPLPVLFPNLSAWRLMGLPLAGLLFVVVVQRGIREGKLAVLVGTACGFFVLMNRESGIAASAGAAVLLVGGHRPAQFAAIIRRLAVFVASIFLGVVVGFLFMRVLVSEFSVVDAMASVFLPSSGLGSGLAGRSFNGWSVHTVLGLLVFSHSAFSLLCAAAVWARQALSQTGLIRATIAAVALVWLAYFANRPDNLWYLWSCLYLFGFFLSDYVNAFSVMLKQASPPSVHSNRNLVRVVTSFAAVFALLLLIGPLALEGNVALLQKGVDEVRAGDPEGLVEFQGISLESTIAEGLAAKAQDVRDADSQGHIGFLTVNAFTMPAAAQVLPGLSFPEPYGETMTVDDYRRLRDEICGMKFDKLLVERADSRFYMSRLQERFYRRLQGDLSTCYGTQTLATHWIEMTRN